MTLNELFNPILPTYILKKKYREVLEDIWEKKMCV